MQIDQKFLDTIPSNSDEYWDHIYLHPSGGNEKGGTENVRFGEVFKLLEGDTILDVGAGYAQLCREIKAQFSEKNVVACDFSEAAAKASHYKPYVVCDCYDLPFNHKEFDLIISTQMMEYLEWPKVFLEKARHIAKKGIFTVPSGESDTHRRVTTYDGDYFYSLLEWVGEIEDFYNVGSLMVGKVNFG